MSFLELGSIRLPTPLGTSSFNIRKVACHMMEKQLEVEQEAFLKIPILGRIWETIANHPKVKQLCEFRDNLVDNHGNGIMLGYQVATSNIRLNQKTMHLSVNRERSLSYFHWEECGKLEMSFEKFLDVIDPKDYWKMIEPANEDSRSWLPSPEYKLESWKSWSDVWKRVDLEVEKVKTKTSTRSKKDGRNKEARVSRVKTGSR